jgi:hypothetical protein
MNIEIRELTDADLDLVSGGEIAGWKFCWGTPRGGGDGLYPLYVVCNGDGSSYGAADLGKDMASSVAGAMR